MSALSQLYNKAFSSRKFLFCAYSLGLAPVMLWFGKIESNAFVAWVTLVSSSYILGQAKIDASPGSDGGST